MSCTVIGSGPGAISLAILLLRNSKRTTIFTRNSNIKKEIIENDLILESRNLLKEKQRVNSVTNNLKEAIENNEWIFISIPANHHDDLAKKLSKIINKDQKIILSPGRTLGAINFYYNLKKYSLNKNLTPKIFEFQSHFCAARKLNNFTVSILALKKYNFCSSYPKVCISEFSNSFSHIFQNLTKCEDSLFTGLNNMGALLHPLPVLLNAGWIESKTNSFSHYYDGISPSVANLVTKLENEVRSITQELNVPFKSLKDWHEENYLYSGSSLYETLNKNSVYASLDAPSSLFHRYLTEDVPTGLVPLSSMAKKMKLKVPIINLVIELASHLLEIDFWQNGRKLIEHGGLIPSKEIIPKIYE